MKKILSCLVAVAFLYSGIAAADDYREVWQCKVKDGKTLEDVQAVNSKWLKWMHENVDKKVSSAVLTTVVGDLTGFIFVDSYPSLDAWSKGKGAQDGNEEMDALDAEFNSVSDCSDNRLWRHRPTS